MAPILYGVELSPPVRAVLLTAKAIGLELEFKQINLMNKEHLTPEYIKMNPQHTVPTLDDNGFIVWDSHAIATYIVGQYAKNDSLYPKDLKKRATVDQRLHFNSSIIFPRLRGIFAPIIFKGMKEIPQESKDNMLEAYGFLETFLDGRSWLAGNQMTLADLCIIASISSIKNIIPIEAAKFPRINAWIAKCEALPYYKEANGDGAANITVFINSKLAA